MAGSVKCDVRGLKELTARLKDLGSLEEVEKISHRGTIGVSKDIRDQAKANIQARGLVASGDMLENVAIKRLVEGTRRGYTVGVRAGTPKQIKTGNDPYYWWWVHFGTKNMPPRPFLTDAFDSIKTRGYAIISTACLNAIYDSAKRAVSRHKNPKKK
jgi:HK97 gp10 family phage protein